AGLDTLEDLVHVGSSTSAEVGHIRPVGHEPPGIRELSKSIHGWQAVLRREFSDPLSVTDGERVYHHDESLGVFCTHRREGGGESIRVSYLRGLELDPELLCHTPQDGQVGGVRRLRWVPKNGDSGNLRNGFFEKFKPLAAKVL